MLSPDVHHSSLVLPLRDGYNFVFDSSRPHINVVSRFCCFQTLIRHCVIIALTWSYLSWCEVQWWAGVITVMNTADSMIDGGNLLTGWATRCVDLGTAQFSAPARCVMLAHSCAQHPCPGIITVQRLQPFLKTCSRL